MEDSHENLQDFDAVVWMISGKKRLGKEATKINKGSLNITCGV